MKPNPQKTKRTQRSEDVEREFTGRPSKYGTDAFDEEAPPQEDAQGSLPASDPTVTYTGPQDGGTCENCQFFQGDQQPCQKVSDPVETGGRCNLFAPSPNQAQDLGQDQGQGQKQGSGQLSLPF